MVARKGRKMTQTVEGQRLRRPTAAFVGMGMDFERDWMFRHGNRWWGIRHLRLTTWGSGKKTVFAWCVATLPEPDFQHVDPRSRDLPQIELGEFRTLAGCVRAVLEWQKNANPKTLWGVLGQPMKELPERDITAVMSLHVPAGVPDAVVRNALQTAMLDHLIQLPSKNLMHGTSLKSFKLAQNVKDLNP